ncbi:MAG: transporter [Candidatus Eremiobacteraeota bacterium]|nr:transporter [Candidatus Eremiobacteraeota bacterium]MBC5822472.1 transporter [Candidatus Eremiobacteraeota bacterium]
MLRRSAACSVLLGFATPLIGAAPAPKSAGANLADQFKHQLVAQVVAIAPAPAARKKAPSRVTSKVVAIVPGNADAAALQATLLAVEERLQAKNGDQQAQINELRSEIAQLKAMRAAGVVGPVSPRSLAAVRPASGATARTSAATTAASATAGGATKTVASAAVPAGAPEQAALTTAPTDASVQSVYQQQNALFRRNLTVTPSITRAYSDNRFFTLNGFLALDAIFLGNINVTQQRSDITELGLNATYGLTDRLQIEGQVPYFSRSTTFSSVGANESGALPSQDRVTSSGIGDVLLGGYYQLAREKGNAPGVTLNAHVSLPTGRSPYGIKLLNDASNSSLQYPGALPTGSGAMGYELGASFVKTSDPAIFFGGANVYYNHPTSFRDLSTDPTVHQPGIAQPGNAFQYQIGTAFALNEKTSLSFAFDDITTGETVLQPIHGKRTSVVGSGTNAAYLSISAGYARDRHQTVITEFDLGLTQDAPNFQLNLRLPHH